MLVTCPSCSTRYRPPDTRDGAAWCRCSRCDDVFPLLRLRPYRLLAPRRGVVTAAAAGAGAIDLGMRSAPPPGARVRPATGRPGIEDRDAAPVLLPARRRDEFEWAMLGLLLGSLTGLGMAWWTGWSEPAGLALGATFGVIAGWMLPWTFRKP